MIPRRSLLLHGLRLVVAHPGALFWTYAFNLGIALLFSARVHAQFSDVLNHSLAAERLNSAFDAGTLFAAMGRVGHNAPSSGIAPYLGLPLYLAIYFLLVPGTLLSYQTDARARLRTLLSAGIDYCSRFLGITLFTLVLFAAVLGPLFALQAAWSRHVEERVTGISAIYQQLPGIILIVLVAALLRLYCDLVEVYTVELGEDRLQSRLPDRRIRKALLPALNVLRRNLLPTYASFLLISLLGLAAVFLTERIAAHMLAQPRVWPMFLLAQAGLFLLLASRNWQRGMECTLVRDNPLMLHEPADTTWSGSENELIGIDQPMYPTFLDAQPNPEPAVPSLAGPDPAVFRHEPRESRNTDKPESIR